MPPMFVWPVTDETSTLTFMLTSWFGCTRGVMSTFTPTSIYWNCVFTNGFTNPEPAVDPTPTPAWKLPVATGTRSPILNFAGCPSTDRTSGFWIILVEEAFNNAFAVQ